MTRERSWQEMKTRIRAATSQDVEMLSAISASTFRETYASNNDPEEVEQHITLHFTLSRIAAEIADPNSFTLLAFAGEELAGYATLQAGDSPPCVQGPSPVELSRIYLLQHRISRGYGSALMRASLEESRRRGFRTMWVGVWDENHRACTFYEKWGFRTVGTLQFVFGTKPYDDLVMARPIPES